MKKIYLNPEVEFIKFSIGNVLSGSVVINTEPVTEQSIPVVGPTEPFDPNATEPR